MKTILLTCVFACTFFLSAEEKTYKVIEDRAGLTIATPGLAKRAVRKLRLENGLEAMLISDPETHESGAALAVAVGSWNDPQDRPGMAHFVEHMLFLGTKKYPEEVGYTRYLDEHGGCRNAFTMADRTVYMFSVNNEGFLGALDRFGQFFIEPLFSPSGVERECKAIHSEFCRNVPLDPWRVLYVKKELANAEHPFHSFCIGNNDSLARISQDELKQWYRDHYSANLMHLVVIAAEDLDTLEKEVTSLFAPVKNTQKEPSRFPVSLKRDEKDHHLCVISPIQEVQALELSWEIPRFFGQDLQIHADKLLSHVLGHEGSSSLLAQLKRENLAEGLGVGNDRAGHDQCFLTLSVQLTQQGVKEYEKVITRCFEAIASIRKSGIPLYLFDEVCCLEEMRYRFQSRQEIFEMVSDYATHMVDEPLETYPRQTLIPSVYSPEKVRELIDCLTPHDCLYTLVAHPQVSNVQPTAKERWMGVDYARVRLAAEKVAVWAHADVHPSISIPRPNPFLPSRLDVKKASVETDILLPQPIVMADEPIGLLYTASDTQFLVPEVSWTFLIKTPEISDAAPITHVFADLYCHTVNEKLNAIAYEAMSAGLAFSLKPKHGALELKVAGYSDKAADFLNTIVAAMKIACPTREQFALYYDLMARDYANTLNANPLKQSGEMMLSILYKDFSGLQQKKEALSDASYKHMERFCNQVLKRCYVQGMLYGNLDQVEAQNVWKAFKQTLACSPYPPQEHPQLKLATLPSHDRASFLTLTCQHPANALILATDCGPFSFKKRAAQEILTKGLEEPFFSELRTRQQTAYLVTNWSQEIERHLYSFFAIQSSSHNSRDLLARFELFLENSLQHLQDTVIPQERFESIRASFIHQLQHPAENLSKMGSLLHTIAFEYDGDFQWLSKRIEAFQELTYPEFVQLTQEFIGKGNTRRLAICSNGTLPKGSITYQAIDSPKNLRKEISYEARIRNNFFGENRQVGRKD